MLQVSRGLTLSCKCQDLVRIIRNLLSKKLKSVTTLTLKQINKVGCLILAELLVLELMGAVWTIFKIIEELVLVKQRFRKVDSTEPERGFLFYVQVLRADYGVSRDILLPFLFLLHFMSPITEWIAAN